MFRGLSEAMEEGGGLAWKGEPRSLAYSRRRLLHLSSGLAFILMALKLAVRLHPLCACLPACTCLCVCTYVSMHVKARGGHWVSSSIAVHLFEAGSLTGLGTH